MTEKLRAIELEAVDIKGARRVRLLLPENEAVHKIGGPNGGGKTSGGADVFWLVMARASEHPPDALRHGASKGHAKIVFSDGMVATRKLRRGRGPELVVTGPDGTRMGAPQSVLDELYKNLGWDLADIMRLSDKELAKRVKELAGIDWTQLEAEHDRVYEERTAINRDADKARALLATMPDEHPLIAQVPDDPVDTEALIAELRRRQEQNARHDGLRRVLETRRQSVIQGEDDVEGIALQISELQVKLARARKDLEKAREQAQSAQHNLECHEPADVTAIEQQLAQSHEVNAAVLAKKQRRAKVEELLTLEAESRTATDRLKWIEEEKRRQLAEAQLPVEGLSFADDGLRFEGVLLSQLNDAQRIRVSAAIGIALSPRLPMVICRHGAHLTRDSLTALEEEVARLGGQALVEHPWLGDDECTAVIRDGVVVGGRQLKLGGK